MMREGIVSRITRMLGLTVPTKEDAAVRHHPPHTHIKGGEQPADPNKLHVELAIERLEEQTKETRRSLDLLTERQALITRSRTPPTTQHPARRVHGPNP